VKEVLISIDSSGGRGHIFDSTALTASARRRRHCLKNHDVAQEVTQAVEVYH